MKNRRLLWLLPLFVLFGQVASAQQDDRRMKIELIVKQGSETIVSTLTSASMAYSRQSYAVDSSDLPVRNFNLAINFDKPAIQIIRAFIKNKNGLDGQIVTTDTYGKLPTRKMEFKSAVMDGLTDQITNDYSTMYLTMRCTELIIDGLKMDL
ncbi:hypothetical protein [Chitinophaga sp.]|uniref:hypothetical protein n=1 Tax=Chitinophaga sp. TaxID=1869181 RepID=UPI0031D07D02